MPSQNELKRVNCRGCVAHLEVLHNNKINLIHHTGKSFTTSLTSRQSYLNYGSPAAGSIPLAAQVASLFSF